MTLDWIKQIDQVALQLEEKPQFGKSLEFSWKDFESRLRDTFNTSMTLTHGTKGWVDSSHILDGIGKNPRILAILWTPLDTPAFFITTEKDLQELMTVFLEGPEVASFFIENQATSAFFDYFSSEVLHILEEIDFANPLKPHLGEIYATLKESHIEEPAFLIDVTLSLKNRNFSGRIALLKSFREEWKKYFAKQPAPPLSDEMRQKIPLMVALEIGKSSLSLQEWKSAKEGDFLLLDHCSYNPETNKGGVLLTLQGKPILRARLKEGAIKITHYPAYEEVTEMDKNLEDEDEENLYGDKELDEDLFEDFPEGLEEKREESGQGVSLSPDEVPIQLTVEVGRLKMSAKELMDLAPGNLLDLHVSPEQGVDLVINGKKVGRGELIRLGEVLGVRILSL